MPWARWNATWTSLWNEGDVARPFNQHRFKAIRDYFSSVGLIDWLDNTYQPHVENSAGVWIRDGRACCWKFGQELMGVLTLPSPTQREEEKASCTAGDLADGVIQLPLESTMMPCLVISFADLERQRELEREEFSLIEFEADKILEQAFFCQYSMAC